MRRALCLAVALRVALPVAAHAVDWSKPRTVSVLMVDDSFVPAQYAFEHGVVYRLHVENRGKELHEFTAPAFFAASLLRNSTQLANGGKEIVLQPGQAADVELVPQRPGKYELTCADHDWDGMVGSIEVK